MASNPHSDFTTHNRTLPTLSNLPIFATWMPCSLQSSFICLATSSFALLNITVLMFLSVPFSIRLTHFPNLISAFDFTLWPSPCIWRYVCVPHLDLSCRQAHMEHLSLLVWFCRYMNVPIASAQNHRGSLELCDITQVPLVVMLFDEGEYGTDKMIQMSCLLQSSFICPATSSFTLLNNHCSDFFVGAILD